VVGCDPMSFLMASSEVPYGVCEYDVIGGIRGAPVDVVKAPITGLPVPANAEIVIEGFVAPGNVRPEGPFGEWMGYYGSDVRNEPVLDILAIYHRNDPILLGCAPQRPPDEIARYRALTRSAIVRENIVKAGVPDVAAAWAARPPTRPAATLEAVEAALLPWYSVALVQDGNEALNAGDAARALNDYRRALGRPGMLPRALVLYNQGQAFERLSLAASARGSYAAALAQDPGFSAARQRLQALDAQAPTAVKAWLRRADALAAQGGRDDEALALYHRALQAGFQNAGLWRNLGVLCLRRGQALKAAEAFQRGLELQPGDKTLTSYLQAAQAAAATR